MPIIENISFYRRFEADILSGKKYITIRDYAAKEYKAGQIVQVSTHEDNRVFARIKILNIEPITLDEINSTHAQQENMSLSVLKKTIREIYPDVKELFVISFSLVN